MTMLMLMLVLLPVPVLRLVLNEDWPEAGLVGVD